MCRHVEMHFADISALLSTINKSRAARPILPFSPLIFAYSSLSSRRTHAIDSRLLCASVSVVQKLIEAQELPDSQNAAKIPRKSVFNEFGCFKVWAGSNRANHPPHKRISLDFRLRDSKLYRVKVVEDLGLLDESLQKGKHG